MVPPFGPGIGKKKVKSCDAFGWNQMFYGVGGVNSEHARVFQILARNFAANLVYATEQAFDPEEIVLQV